MYTSVETFSTRPLPTTVTECTRCWTRSWRLLRRKRPSPGSKRSLQRSKRRLQMPLTCLKMASSRRRPYWPCPGSTGAGCGRRICQSALSKKSDGEKRLSIRIFPNRESAYRLVGALCAETHEERSTGRRYLNPGGCFRWRADLAVEDSSDEEALLNGKRATQPTAVPA